MTYLQTYWRGGGDRRGRGLLASNFTDYLVGTTLFIDGGMTLYPEVDKAVFLPSIRLFSAHGSVHR